MTRLKRFKTAGGLAGFTVAALIAALVPGAALTNASWTDNEFDHGTVGTENCATAANFNTRGAGKLIGGSLLGTNLDAAASLNGVTVTNGSAGLKVTPAGSTSLGSDAYQNALNVTALSTINADLGTLLQLPLSTGVGVVNQYGQAHTNGSSTGASGVVDNSGAIALASGVPSASVPTFATLDLQTILSQLGISATNIADLNLTIGAVGSSAQLNGCNAMWTKSVYSNLVRQYVIAGLTTNITSPLVGNLVSSVNTTTGALTTAVNGIAGNTGLLNTAASGITTALGPVLSTLGLGTPTVTASASVDFSGLTTLLNTPIQDSGHIVTIDLAHGTIAVNTAALFDSVHGLNSQAPNTQLLINTTVLNALKTAITGALNNYVASVTAAIDSALDAIKVNLAVSLPVTVPVVGAGLGISLAATNVSLKSLEDGTAAITPTITCSLGIGCAAAVPVLQGILTLAGTAVAKAIEQPLGNGIAGVLNPLVASLTTTLNTTTGGIEDLLANTLGGLFGTGSLLSLVVNAQNLPDPSKAIGSAGAPVWAGGLTAASTSPYGTGQYDVSAIELTVLRANVTLDLARSSVGSNVVIP